MNALFIWKIAGVWPDLDLDSKQRILFNLIHFFCSIEYFFLIWDVVLYRSKIYHVGFFCLFACLNEPNMHHHKPHLLKAAKWHKICVGSDMYSFKLQFYFWTWIYDRDLTILLITRPFLDQKLVNWSKISWKTRRFLRKVCVFQLCSKIYVAQLCSFCWIIKVYNYSQLSVQLNPTGYRVNIYQLCVHVNYLFLIILGAHGLFMNFEYNITISKNLFRSLFVFNKRKWCESIVIMRCIFKKLSHLNKVSSRIQGNSTTV